ncbi:MAG TPA: hypothetical protein VIM55_13535 [Mucilaginibacter sp.]
MADLNKFQRSKERINEILNYLMMSGAEHQSNPYVHTLQQSIRVIDAKIEALQKEERGKKKYA